MGNQATARETLAMRRAIELSLRATGCTSPNPLVGCVIFDRDGKVAGAGYHRRAGGPHAEVEALTGVGSAAAGGTAVVTLEPCAHTRKTGACVTALRRAGVARVVYAVPDPTAEAGGGGAVLRAAGIAVVPDVLRAEAERANEHWLTAARLGRPFVTWKYAGSVDGFSAASDGSSRWITGEQARQDAHELRATHDAVVVGAGTFRVDNPHLGLRHGVQGKAPLRVVVGGDGQPPPGSRILDGPAPVLFAVGADRVRGDDARILPVPRVGADLDVGALLTALYNRGVRSVLLEGGATLAASFVAAGFVDQVVAYLAPVLFGDGRGVLGDIGVHTVEAARRLRVDSAELVDVDLRVVMRPQAQEGLE